MATRSSAAKPAKPAKPAAPAETPSTPPMEDPEVVQALTELRERAVKAETEAALHEQTAKNLAAENAQLAGDKESMAIEINNLRLKRDELQSLAGAQRHEIDAQAEELSRQTTSAVPHELPGMFYALKIGQTDRLQPDALEERLIETEEEQAALMEEAAQTKREWVHDPNLL